MVQHLSISNLWWFILVAVTLAWANNNFITSILLHSFLGMWCKPFAGKIFPIRQCTHVILLSDTTKGRKPKNFLCFERRLNKWDREGKMKILCVHSFVNSLRGFWHAASLYLNSPPILSLTNCSNINGLLWSSTSKSTKKP